MKHTIIYTSIAILLSLLARPAWAEEAVTTGVGDAAQPIEAAPVATDSATQTADTTSSGAGDNSVEAEIEVQTQHMDALAATQGEKAVSGKIAADFTGFAGSQDNADALAAGLRNGTEITLTTPGTEGTGTAVTFTPPTGHMGNGNVYKSLALAKQQLADIGITDPTPDQIQTALMGGTLTVNEGVTTSTHEMTGILQMRSDGMGWGNIAKATGAKLGTVMKSMKSANAHIEDSPDLDVDVATSTDIEVTVETDTGAATTAGKSRTTHTTAKGSAKGKVVSADGAVKGKGATSSAGASKSTHAHTAKSRIVNAAGATTVTSSGKARSAHTPRSPITNAGGQGGGYSASAKGGQGGGNGHLKK